MSLKKCSICDNSINELIGFDSSIIIDGICCKECYDTFISPILKCDKSILRMKNNISKQEELKKNIILSSKKLINERKK